MSIEELKKELEERKLYSELIVKYSQSSRIGEDLIENDFEIEILEEQISKLETAYIEDIAS